MLSIFTYAIKNMCLCVVACLLACFTSTILSRHLINLIIAVLATMKTCDWTKTNCPTEMDVVDIKDSWQHWIMDSRHCVMCLKPGLGWILWRSSIRIKNNLAISIYFERCALYNLRYKVTNKIWIKSYYLR